MLIRITAPHFVAGAITEVGIGNDYVAKAAPIIRYMKGWPVYKVKAYCAKKRWVYKPHVS